MSGDEETVGIEMAARESQDEYMARVVAFAARITPMFVAEGQKSHDRQGGGDRIEEVAAKAGIDREKFKAEYVPFDGKFALLSAVAVALGVLRMAPVEMRGRLMQDSIDFMLVNADLTEASMKQVLYNSLMQIGNPTGEIAVEMPRE